LAEIEPGQCVLEPSAGTGNLCRAVIESVDTEVLAYEINSALCSQLSRTFPSYKVKAVCSDFLQVSDFMGAYPRIVMNPPFADSQDIAHVRHAYKFLAPGGRLVAIMGEGAFYRQDRAASGFREWLEEIGGTSEKLPAGSFETSGTGVNARLVVIEKGAN
jgi:16S rRNA G1207 methylase RsmC